MCDLIFAFRDPASFDTEFSALLSKQLASAKHATVMTCSGLRTCDPGLADSPRRRMIHWEEEERIQWKTRPSREEPEEVVLYGYFQNRLLLECDEDGYQVHYRMDGSEEAHFLPESSLVYMQGAKGEEHKVLEIHLDLRIKCYFTGPQGEERKVRVDDDTEGTVTYYVGAKEEEVRIRKEHVKSGIVESFNTEDDSLVSMRYPNGKLCYFRGLPGKECLKICHHINGSKTFFEGAQGQERIRMRKWPDGTVDHMEGDHPKERVARQIFKDGSVVFYEGAKGEERYVKREGEVRNGCHVTSYFTGACGMERLIREEFSNGIRVYFEGKKGQERCVRVEHNGCVRYVDKLGRVTERSRSGMVAVGTLNAMYRARQKLRQDTADSDAFRKAQERADSVAKELLLEELLGEAKDSKKKKKKKNKRGASDRPPEGLESEPPEGLESEPPEALESEPPEALESEPPEGLESHQEAEQEAEQEDGKPPLEESKECIVCLEEEKDTALIPCGHLCSCSECAVHLEECPLCRQAVASRIRIFL